MTLHVTMSIASEEENTLTDEYDSDASSVDSYNTLEEKLFLLRNLEAEEKFENDTIRKRLSCDGGDTLECLNKVFKEKDDALTKNKAWAEINEEAKTKLGCTDELLPCIEKLKITHTDALSKKESSLKLATAALKQERAKREKELKAEFAERNEKNSKLAEISQKLGCTDETDILKCLEAKSILDTIDFEYAVYAHRSTNSTLAECTEKLQDLREQHKVEIEEATKRLNESDAENEKLVAELQGQLEESVESFEQIKIAERVLECGDDRKLEDCAQDVMIFNEGLFEENEKLRSENNILTKQGYNFAPPSPPSSPPTRATGRTANGNNKYFRPGSVAAARYPPYTRF